MPPPVSGCYLMVLFISLWRVPVAPEVPTSLGFLVQLSGPTLVQQFCAFPLLGGWAAWALRPCGESLGSCAGLVLSQGPRCRRGCWACLGSFVLGGPTFLRMGWTLRLHVVHCRGLARLALSYSAPVGLLSWGAHPACGLSLWLSEALCRVTALRASVTGGGAACPTHQRSRLRMRIVPKGCPYSNLSTGGPSLPCCCFSSIGGG